VQIALEMLQQRHLLGKCLRNVLLLIRADLVLLVLRFPLNVMDLIRLRLEKYLGRIVEENPVAAVAQQIPHPVLRAVVHILKHHNVLFDQSKSLRLDLLLLGALVSQVLLTSCREEAIGGCLSKIVGVLGGSGRVGA